MNSDQAYLDFNIFDGDRDVCIEFRKVKIVITKLPHECAAGGLLDGVHVIEPKSRALKETAKVEGEVRSCYQCLPCLDRLMVDGWWLN